MITDPLVILPPDGHVFPPIVFFANFPRCRCHFEQDIVLAISSPFLGGAAMEVCGFFSPVAERLAR